MKHRPKIHTDEAVKSNHHRSRQFLARLAVVGCLATVAVILFVRRSPPAQEFAQVVLINSTGCKHSATQTVGTVIGSDIVLTVAHGVAGQDENTIVSIDGRLVVATIAAIDTELDLAVLYAPGLNLKPLAFGEAVAGSSAVFVAFDEGRQVTRPAKVIRRVQVNTNDIYLRGEISRPGIEVQAEVKIGNSGGPIINDKSEVVAIAWATSRVEVNRTWATVVQAASDLLSADATATIARPVACTG